MCRLLGIAANQTVHLTFSLLDAPNALRKQTPKNPHGWGIAAHNKDWNVWKNSDDAGKSDEFQRRSHDAHGDIIISHIRQATVGLKTPANSHPFRFGNWILAHNGTVRGAQQLSIGKFAPLGDTDSERILCAILNEIQTASGRVDRVSLKTISESLSRVMQKCVRLDPKCKVNLLFSDGRRLFVFRHGHPLFWLIRAGGSSSMQSRTLKMLEEAKVKRERALLVATEKLTDEAWQPVEPDRLVYVDPAHPEKGLQETTEARRHRA